MRKLFNDSIRWLVNRYNFSRKDLVYSWVEESTFESSGELYSLLNGIKNNLVLRRYHEYLQTVGLRLINIDGTHWEVSVCKFSCRYKPAKTKTIMIRNSKNSYT